MAQAWRRISLLKPASLPHWPMPPCWSTTCWPFIWAKATVSPHLAPAQPINKEFCSQLKLDALVKQCFVRLSGVYCLMAAAAVHHWICASPYTPSPPARIGMPLKMTFAVVCWIFTYFPVCSIDIWIGIRSVERWTQRRFSEISTVASNADSYAKRVSAGKGEPGFEFCLCVNNETIIS